MDLKNPLGTIDVILITLIEGTGSSEGVTGRRGCYGVAGDLKIRAVTHDSGKEFLGTIYIADSHPKILKKNRQADG